MLLRNLILAYILLYPSISSSTDKPCPDDMVYSSGICIDQFEFPNKRGEKPLLALSGVKENDAEAYFAAENLCKSVGKRVCTRNEWRVACKGADHLKYSYGNKYNPTACNTDKIWLPADNKKIAKRDKDHLNYLNQSEPSGAKENCVNSVGVYDMVGNAEEWVKCDSGKYGWCLVGGYWAESRSSCDYNIIVHAPNFHYYGQSTRCCLDIE